MADATAAAAPPVFRSPQGEAAFMAAYDAVLAGWPAPHETLNVPTRLGLTHVIASGPADAPSVILLHSLAASAAVWQPNVAALSQHFHVYAVDIVGQVGKSTPSRAVGDRHDIAGWLTDLMDGLGVARASLVGASYGGFLALNQASLTPDRVDRIALISPAASFVGFSLGFHWAMRVKGPILRRWRALRGRPATRLPGGMRLDPTPGTWGALMRIAMTQSGIPSLAEAIVFSRAELARVAAPTLLLIGEHEILYDARATLALARRRLPTLTGAVIPNADHLAAVTQPADVNARLLAFLTPSR